MHVDRGHLIKRDFCASLRWLNPQLKAGTQSEQGIHLLYSGHTLWRKSFLLQPQTTFSESGSRYSSSGKLFMLTAKNLPHTRWHAPKKGPQQIFSKKLTHAPCAHHNFHNQSTKPLHMRPPRTIKMGWFHTCDKTSQGSFRVASAAARFTRTLRHMISERTQSHIKTISKRSRKQIIPALAPNSLFRKNWPKHRLLCKSEYWQEKLIWGPDKP